MSDSVAATSIFEFLTYPNPDVTHVPPRSTTNSRGLKWHCPRQIKRWEDFDNLDVLKTSFGGHLLLEARRAGRQLPPYPTLHPQADCELCEEDDTRDLINKWNKTIVTEALRAIDHEFHPVVWCKGNRPVSKEQSEPPPQQEKARTQPPRKSSSKARAPRMQSLSRLRSDSGTIRRDTQRIGNNPVRLGQQERFPKEYKPATKWKSRSMVERALINELGEWVKGKMNDNHAMPIRQAYSYCIQHMCRYGCILTCEEAFIFRVRPRDKELDGSADPTLLRRRLIQNGLMEYVSIPWKIDQQGDVNSHDKWTINLALWFVHVLAGNSFEVRWQYTRLEDETLMMSTSSNKRNQLRSSDGEEDVDGSEEEDEDSTSDDSDDSETTLPFEISPTMKRKRNPGVEEEFHLSFSKRQALEI